MHDTKLSRLFDRYRSHGDLAALAEVFDHVSPELLRVARHVAGRGVESEDVLQATFLAAIERATTFDSERPLVPWLMGILINQARLARRRMSRTLDEETGSGLPDTHPVDDNAETQEFSEAVSRALAGIPETYREVLLSHLNEGKKPHEIARELNRPQGTVRAQLYRGIRLMRKTLPAGFALGVAALFTPRASAQVRERVLRAAARRVGADPHNIPDVSSAWRVPAGVAAALLVGAALWLGLSGSTTKLAAAPALAATDARGIEGRETLRESGVAFERTGSGTLEGALPDARPTVLEPYGSLLVQLRDANGAAVEGVKVTMLQWGDPRWFENVREMLSDAQGNALFERVREGRVAAHVDGNMLPPKDGERAVGSSNQTYQRRTDVAAGGCATLLIELAPGLCVTGRVVDEEDRPVRGARVEVWRALDSLPVACSAATGADGTFRLEDVDRRALLSARVSGYQPSALAWLGTPALASADDAELCLRVHTRAARVAGYVIDERGAAVSGARILLFPEAERELRWSGQGEASFGTPLQHVVSGADGGFVMDGGCAGAARLRVEHAHFAPTERALELALGSTEALTIALGRSAGLSGTLKYSDGSPAFGTRVSLASPDLRAPLETRTDESGHFAIHDAPAGSWRISARAGGIGPELVCERQARAGEVLEWFDVVQRCETITGTAFGENGKTVTTWLVRAIPQDRPHAGSDAWLAGFERDIEGHDGTSELLQCWIDPRGRFIVPCESGKRHRLELRPRGSWRGPVLAALDDVEAGQRNVTLRSLNSRGWIRGRLVDEVQRPLESAVVMVTAGSVECTITRPMDPKTGEFRLELVPDTYELIVLARGRQPRRLGQFELQMGTTIPLGDVVFEPAGALDLQVRAGLGETLPELDAELTRADGLACKLERGANGAWSAHGLDAGDYTLALAPRGKETRREKLTIRSGEKLEQRVRW